MTGCGGGGGDSSTPDSTTTTTTDTTAPSSPSISIDSGASSTTSTSVTLTLSATDDTGVTGYYASETSTTPSASASGWTSVTSTTSYLADVSFTLSSSSGTKTVYVWFKDAAGNVATSASDRITSVIVTAISGAVTPPSGVSSSSLTVVSLGNTASVDSTGSFSTQVYEEGVTVVAAMSPGKEFGLMNVVSTYSTAKSTSENDGGQTKVRAAYKSFASNSMAIELNAKTTAVSMVFVTPYFLTNDQDKAANIISVIEADPKVAILANVIESVFNEADPLENTTLQTALTDAITSVLNTIQISVTSSASTSKSVNIPSSSPKIIQLPKRSKDFSNKLTAKTETQYSIDTNYIKLGITESSDGYNIDVDSIGDEWVNPLKWNAVDWIGEIGQLDSSQFTSLTALTNKSQNKNNIYIRIPNQNSAVGRDRAEAKGFLRWFDFIGNAMDVAIGKIFNWAMGPDGVKISSNTDGVYIVRAFSGGGWGSDSAERNLISSVPNGDSNNDEAFMLNITSAVIDTMSVIVPLADYKECVEASLTTLMDLSSSIYQGSITSVDDIIGNTVPSIVENLLSLTGSCVDVKNETSKLIKGIAKINKVVNKLKGMIPYYKWFEIAGSIGKATERGIKLYWYATPLESAFIVVGNPFGSDTTGTVPSAPTGVTATAGNGQVTISWSSVSGATSYNIYWSTSSGVIKTTGTKLTGATSPYTHTGRTNGTTYYYIVTAVNSSGESSESSQVSAIPTLSGTSDTTAPSSSSVSINSGASSTTSTSVTLTLSATDNVGVTGYYASETSTTPSASASGWTTITSATSYSATASFTLSSGSGTKTVYVWFKDAAGNVSARISDSITLGTSPPPPTGVTATAGNGQVTISWNSVSGATSYNICWSITWGVTKTTGTKIASATSPYTHTGRSNGTTYYYVVTAVNSSGESSESSQVSATPQSGTTIISTVPSAPSNLTATALSQNNIALTWWDNSTDETGFKIERKTGTTGTFSQIATVGAISGTGSGGYYENSGLSASTTYCYRVRAYNSAGDSSYSSESCATTNAPPPIQPTATTSSATNITSSSATLNGTVNPNGVSTGIFFQYGTSTSYGNTTTSQVVGSGTSSVNVSANLTGLSSNTTYNYRIVATNSFGGTVFGANQTFITTSSGSTQQTERLTNGSFSSGASGWALVSNFWAGTNLTRYRTSPGYASGGVDSTGSPKNNASGYMYQTVTIPSGATSATLSFWLNITSDESTTTIQYDKLYVEVLNSSGTVLTTLARYSNLNKGTACGTTCSYNQKSFNLTSYKGQTIRIQFRATTDGATDTVFRIDDVSIMSNG